MPTDHEAELLSLEGCASDVVTARFSRPAGFQFAAGQWMRLTLSAKDAEPLSETFTICSAPSDAYLEVTTRLSNSPFKRRLKALRVGETVGVTGPGGRLGLPEGATRLAFLVGGVGITPVRSMLRDAYGRGVSFDDALVFYGNRDESCVPFRAELEGMADRGVRVVLCLEHPSLSWEGESGLITAPMIRRYLPTGVDGRPFVVAGPPVMVEAMLAVLDDLGVEPELRLVERFSSPTARTAAEGQGSARAGAGGQ